MLHLQPGDCPNCNASASSSIASVHAVKASEERDFGNLFIPDKATRELLELDAIDWNVEMVALLTRRRGPGAGQVDVDAKAVKRLSPSEPEVRRAAELHVIGQVLRYFQGHVRRPDAERMILSWTSGDGLLR